MKKIVLFLSAIVLLATSCTDKEAYTVTGKVTDKSMEGKDVYLQNLKEDGEGFEAIDTAKIVNGLFVFKGKAGQEPSVKFITVATAPDQNAKPVLFILEAGNIEINIDSTVTTTKGTTMNDQYQVFAAKRDVINNKLIALGNEYRSLTASGQMTPEQEERINNEFETNAKEMGTILFEYTKSNIKNPIGEFFFKTGGHNFDDAQLKELLSLVNPKFKEDKKVQKLEKYLQSLEATAIGQPFIDVKGKTPEGKEIALSEYAGKGKVVLIDFWAAWCGPCIKEMPNVVEAYKKYKGKGLEIVGISLDEDNTKWANAITSLGITWPQMSDLKGWDSELSAAYGVKSIPHTVLLDKEGKIIAKDLRGKELLSKLDELLK